VIGTAKDRHRGGYDFSQCGVERIGTLKDSLTPSQYIYVKK
jgi:hypothetical protein